MNEYLATDSGGYLCTNILGAVIAAWLDAFQRGRDGVGIEQVCQGVKYKTPSAILMIGY